MEASDFEARRAPYAPISALREFLERMRGIGVPQRADKKFLQKLNVASNNEWALLSALKFLGIVDQHGAPTTAYRGLQSDRFQETLRHLVETAYAPLFNIGGATMTLDELVNYFRLESSPSQAKNAARFFREVSAMAGIGNKRDNRVYSAAEAHAAVPDLEPEDQPVTLDKPTDAGRSRESPSPDLLLETKARLLEKLPAPRPDWTAAEYEAICARFLELLKSLDSAT